MIAGVVIVGGGLAGGLLALALRERGMAVTLVDGGSEVRATTWSYGLLQPAALRPWRQLQQRYGDLGLRRVAVRFHGDGSWRRWLPPLPLAQVQTATLSRALPAALERAGVCRLASTAVGVPQRLEGYWRLELDGGRKPLMARQLVLAAGAGCRSLWPALPDRLRVSWAGVLELVSLPPIAGRPRRGALLPAVFRRVALERAATALAAPAWIVDPGVVPSADGWLAGQITLLQPADRELQAPDPAWMEGELRHALGRWMGGLEAGPARYHQVPVSFCTDGQPMSGPVDGVPALWICAGFSAAFSQLPAAVALLADQIVAATTVEG